MKSRKNGNDTNMEMKNNCCCKETKREESTVTALQNRLKRMEGQLRGIRGMLDNDAYCVDVLTQSAAVSAALAAFEREVLSAHLHGCVRRDLSSGDPEKAEESLDELTALLGRLLK